MAIHFACPTCRARLNVPNDAVGGTVRCPKCRSLDRVPSESETVDGAVEDTDEQPVPLFPSVTGEVVAAGNPAPTNLVPVREPAPISAGRFQAGFTWGAGFWLAALVVAGAAAVVRAVLLWVND
jgi:predicted Zn finger-like uncharacterized protein